MARYRHPPDPRDRNRIDDRSGTGLQKERAPIPWLWLGLGALVTILGIGAAVLIISSFLDRPPLSTTLPTPTIIRLTAPATPLAAGTDAFATATQIPTFTPPPTLDLSVAPNEVTVGFYAQVHNTDGFGVSLRGGPSTDNVRLEVVSEGEYVLVSGGPAEGDGFIWWQVQYGEDSEGWIVGDFLRSAAAPSSDDQ